MSERKFMAFTIIARNYAAQAHVAAQSFIAHHPTIEFCTLIIDGDQSDRARAGLGEVLLLEDLGLDPDVLESMMLIYDARDLSTALEPATLLALMRRSANAVAYFGPDTKFYAPVDDVFEAADVAGVALTPHVMGPIPSDGVERTKQSMVHTERYGPGFICVGSRAVSFLLWWNSRLVAGAIVDVENALSSEKRLIDGVPSLFPHVMLSDPGLGAAHWYMHGGALSQHDGHYFFGSDPLRFFQFSGYSPLAASLPSTHFVDQPPTLLSESPLLRQLCDEYARDVLAAGFDNTAAVPYGHGALPHGMPLDQRVRRVVREALIDPHHAFAPVPSAFSDTRAFVGWLHDPSLGSGSVGISPAEYSIWLDRPDVREAYPEPLGVDSSAFSQWCRAEPWAHSWLSQMGRTSKGNLESAGSASNRRSRGATSRRGFGWSVVAYANAELGVGEAGRRTFESIAATGVPVELVGTRYNTASRQSHRLRDEVHGTPSFENVITCVNADQLPQVYRLLELGELKGKHVGLWFWELERFPNHGLPSLSYVHEVWVASAFTQRALRAVTDKKIRLIRMPIRVPDRATAFTRRNLGLPEAGFLFLTNFDYFSAHRRKNPIGVIEAYRAAFGPDDGAVLVVKSINGSQRLHDAERVRAAAGSRPDIFLLDGYVTSAEMAAMIELADCYVSLHRAEGYGINLADAMARGTPTIATGYSGNMEFMTPTTSLLVPYELTPVGADAEPYDPTALWAEPDMGKAAHSMRALFEDEQLGKRIASAAREHVLAHHSIEAAAQSLRSTLLMLKDSEA